MSLILPGKITVAFVKEGPDDGLMGPQPLYLDIEMQNLLSNYKYILLIYVCYDEKKKSIFL
jgi:hypothetical protein